MAWLDDVDKAIERLRKLRALQREQAAKKDDILNIGTFLNRTEKENATKPPTPPTPPSPANPPPGPIGPMQMPAGARPWWQALLVFIIGVSVFSYIYYLTPVHGIVDTTRVKVLAFLPQVWSDFIFNFLPGLVILVFLAFSLLGSLFSKRFNIDFLRDFFFAIGAIYLSAAVLIGIGYIVYVYLLGAGVLTPYLCSLSLKDLLSIDPNAADKCLTQKQATPDNTKNGLTTLEQSSLGGNQAGGVVPTVYQGEIYILPFSIKNLDPDNILDGVYVKGKLVGQQKVNGQLQDYKTDFIPNTCSSGDPCNIPGGATQVVSLQTPEKISFYSPGYADVTVNTIYPYTAFGKGDVIAANSNAVIPQDAFTKPESGPGPVDVVVFFSPQYFNLDGKLSKIIMFVSIINRGQGLIDAKSMLIKRLTSSDILGTGTCKVPGFDTSFAENNKQSFDGLEFKSEAQFVCTLQIQQPANKITQFVHIPFTATFEYNYIETVTDSYPVRMLGS